MKKVRAATVVAVMATAVTKVREYAKEHPEQAGRAADAVEDFVRGRTAPKRAPYLDKGSKAVRMGLGIPLRPLAPLPEVDLEDPDPDTDEPWHPHAKSDTVAPNPAPGTGDDPQPRHHFDEPGPMTPGEHLGS